MLTKVLHNIQDKTSSLKTNLNTIKIYRKKTDQKWIQFKENIMQTKNIIKLKYVLREYLKVDRVGDSLINKGWEFQSLGPRPEKALSPLDLSEDFGTFYNIWVDDLSVLSGE